MCAHAPLPYVTSPSATLALIQRTCWSVWGADHEMTAQILAGLERERAARGRPARWSACSGSWLPSRRAGQPRSTRTTSAWSTISPRWAPSLWCSASLSAEQLIHLGTNRSQSIDWNTQCLGEAEVRWSEWAFLAGVAGMVVRHPLQASVQLLLLHACPASTERYTQGALLLHICMTSEGACADPVLRW